MGSFNTACVISQQIIKPKDEVYILPISQSYSYDEVKLEYTDYSGKIINQKQYSYANTTCYATAFWDNAGPLFEGNYEDYGQFKLNNSESNTKNMHILFNLLYNESAKTLEGENSSHDIPFDMKEIYNPKENYTFKGLEDIWNSMWEAMQENRIFVKTAHDAFRPFAFAVAHKVAVDYFVNQYKDLPGIVKKDLETNYETLKKFFVDLNDLLPEQTVILKDMISWPLERMLSLENVRFSQGSEMHLAYKYRGSKEYLDNVFEVLKNNHKISGDNKGLSQESFEFLYKEIKPLLLHKIILGGMEEVNVKLSPMPYGSQDYCNDIGNSYAKMIKEVNKTIKEQIKSERCEEEDEVDVEEKPARKRKMK